ncbi:unnamed protein product [Cercospora beticola]|nr:unnamed protein product [Cercospora beticola]
MASKMKRKFSFDIPRLKIGHLGNIGHNASHRTDRNEHRDWKDHYASPPESRPPTPKSVRPPMPNDIEAELRAACTYVITHPKPSHEVWGGEAAKPALDYAAIKAGPVAEAVHPARTSSMRHRHERSQEPPHSSRYAYKPNVATEDLFNGESHGSKHVQRNARSRADMLMAGDAVKNMPSRMRPRVEPSETSHPPASNTEKSKPLQRSDSVGTSGSTPHTDSTDYPWSASTGLTSAVNTPARSKRTSGQAIPPTSESGSAPQADFSNGDWLRAELEKHKKVMEERERAKTIDPSNQSDNTSTTQTPVLPAPYSHVPARKPVPARSASRPGDQNQTRPGSKDQHDAERGRPFAVRTDSRQPQIDIDTDSRGRMPVRSNSRLGRASRAASRAATDVKGVTQDLFAHVRRHESNRATADPIERPPSRAREIAHGMKEYFRPGTASGFRSGRPSGEYTRGHVRNQSIGSMQTSTSETRTSSDRAADWKKWHPPTKAFTNVTQADSSRPASGTPAKTQVDLNRELPPLPGLDSWKDEEPATVHQGTKAEPSSHLKLPSSPSFVGGLTPAYHGLRRVLSRASLKSPASPVFPHKDDQVSSNSSQSRKTYGDSDGPRPNTRATYGNSATSSPMVEQFSQLSITKSTDRMSAHSSGQDSTREHTARADMPRSDSPQSKHESEQGQRVRKPHITDYRRAAGPPLSGSSRAWGRTGQRPAGTTASISSGHSRQNSDRSHAPSARSADQSRQDSTTEFGQEKKKHWWQAKEREKGQANWMDHVPHFGSRRGTGLDSVAGAHSARS